MDFKEYMHIERFGVDGVQGIGLGECYIFPKIDGTNASVWGGNRLYAGSRKRKLTIQEDNAGFYDWVLHGKHELWEFFFKTENRYRLYGEWLVPHTLKTYRNDAWRKFYVFDVYDEQTGKYIPYDAYQPMLEDFHIIYIPPLCVMHNTTFDSLVGELERNYFLIKDGEGIGEGIVIKNYSYVNRYGRTVWAKMVTNRFKESHIQKEGAPIKKMKSLIEPKLCEKYVTKHLVDKVYAKIVNETEGWNSKYIPRLLGTVFHDLVTEELWNIVKTFKCPVIDFKTLNYLTIAMVRELKPELF